MLDNNKKIRPNLIVTELATGFPDLLELHQLNPERYPYLLESVAHGNSQARYDILFAFPGESLVLDESGSLHGQDIRGNDFLQNLDRLWLKEKRNHNPDIDLPFRGGWFVFLAYELAEQIEPVLNLPQGEKLLPTAFATRIACAVIRDHVTERCWILAEDEVKDRLGLIRSDIDSLPDVVRPAASFACSIEEQDPRRYLQAVELIRHYITEGDVFQVNLSREWRACLDQQLDDAVLYRALRTNNPAPFAGLIRFNGSTLFSSSPERLVSVCRQNVETRPIAGTRPRGSILEADHMLSGELLAHPKERAEHIMLVDLERNDLGRVCQPGSIEVNELMVLESYAHVHHIVSNVRGRLRDGIAPGEIIRAVFPGGTITGCPKIRCMEIIAQLEQVPREAYTGSMGYLNMDGDMDLNILIRTMIRRGNTVSLRAGAGIVADSIAQNELEETRDKARGLLRALGIEDS